MWAEIQDAATGRQSIHGVRTERARLDLLRVGRQPRTSLRCGPREHDADISGPAGFLDETREWTMSEIRKGAVTLKGNPVDVAGTALRPGDAAPEFSLQSTALEDITLAASAGKVRIVATIPSLDTSTCHAETKRFNDEVAKLTGVEVLVVSMDLPFGQKRWCGAEGVENVKTLSAHRCTKFGEDYGVLIKGGPLDRCLCRAVFVIDARGAIRFAEYCSEIADHPNYAAVLAAASAAA